MDLKAKTKFYFWECFKHECDNDGYLEFYPHARQTTEKVTVIALLFNEAQRQQKAINNLGLRQATL